MPETPVAHRPRPPWWLPAYLAGFVLLGLWNGLNAWTDHRRDAMPPPAWHVFVWELSSVLVMAGLALLVRRLEARWPITGVRAWKHLPVHALGGLLYSLVHVVLMVALRKAVYAAAGEHYDFGPALPAFFYEFQKDLLTYISLVVAWALLREIRERRVRQIDELTLRRDLAEARLAHLSAQIEPHFVFNALNAIANRMYEDVPAADRMLVALADLLRTAMTADGSDFVAVAAELRWLEAYAALMCERQPGLLRVDIVAGDGVSGLRLPRLLLQPLVENAFRHGLRDGRGWIGVTLSRADGWLLCRVEDDGVGIAEDAPTGVGLANVRERLSLLYPDRHRFGIGPRDGGGTVATVRLPAEPMA